MVINIYLILKKMILINVFFKKTGAVENFRGSLRQA